MPYAIDGNLLGENTISIIGLNREPLNEKRRTYLALVNGLLNVIAVANDHMDNIELQNAAKGAKQTLEQTSTPAAEYSVMIEARLAKLPEFAGIKTKT